MRLKLWFFYTIGLIVFVSALVGLNPAIAAGPVGFASIFLPCLAVALLLDWGVSWLGVPVLPTLVRAFTIFTVWAVFMSMGSAPAGIASFFLLLVAFTYSSMATRRRRIALERREFENHFRQSYSMEGAGTLRAARGIPTEPWPGKRRAR